MLELKNISAGYSKNSLVLKDISFNIENNKTVGIIGQNGAGKSTIVKAILNMLPNVSGDIIYKNNINLKKPKTFSIISNNIGCFMQVNIVFIYYIT